MAEILGSDTKKFTVGGLFAGIGGIELGFKKKQGLIFYGLMR